MLTWMVLNLVNPFVSGRCWRQQFLRTMSAAPIVSGLSAIRETLENITSTLTPGGEKDGPEPQVMGDASVTTSNGPMRRLVLRGITPRHVWILLIHAQSYVSVLKGREVLRQVRI